MIVSDIIIVWKFALVSAIFCLLLHFFFLCLLLNLHCPVLPLGDTHTQRSQLVLVRLEDKERMAFAGTTQKCMACDKTVYLVDKLTADNRVFHKACFRCHHCKGTLKVSLPLLQFLLIIQSLVQTSSFGSGVCNLVIRRRVDVPDSVFGVNWKADRHPLSMSKDQNTWKLL